MPENNDTPEEIAARKSKSDVDFIRTTIEGTPDEAIRADDIEADVVELLEAEGYVHAEWAGGHLFAKTQAILDDDGKRSGRIPA